MNDKNKKVKEKCVIAKVCRFSITNPSLDKIMTKIVKHTLNTQVLLFMPNGAEAAERPTTDRCLSNER